MKATLEFNLPEEAHEHLMATKAGARVSVIEEYRRVLREHYKYGKTTSARHQERAATYNDAANELWTIIEEAGVAELFE